MSHEPMLCTSAREGSWCRCSCQWHSATYTTVTGAHIAFGKHLLEVAR